MSGAIDSVDSALREVEQARRRLKRGRNRQVRSHDELDYARAVSYAWFRSHRPRVFRPGLSCADVDAAYQRVLDATQKNSARVTYVAALEAAKLALAAFRSELLIHTSNANMTGDVAPEFDSLAGDAAMRLILERRWSECQKCIAAEAYLAATVMMGGLLEALLVARMNLLSNKAPVFTAKMTPRDKQGKSLPLNQWTLQPYLDVAHELGWITASAKDVGVVLRDYRNYVHPAKERSHGVELGVHDATMFWQLTKSLTHQLLSTT